MKNPRSGQISSLDPLRALGKVPRTKFPFHCIHQELDHAKAQCLDAQRAEKLLKVDFHQLEKRVSELGFYSNAFY